jgi:cell division GTPase FtsZ
MEVNEAADKLQSLIDPDANFIWGIVYDESMGDEVQMVVIATGFDMDSQTAGQGTQAGAPKQGQPHDNLFDADSLIDTPAYLRKREKK